MVIQDTEMDAMEETAMITDAAMAVMKVGTEDIPIGTK